MDEQTASGPSPQTKAQTLNSQLPAAWPTQTQVPELPMPAIKSEESGLPRFVVEALLRGDRISNDTRPAGGLGLRPWSHYRDEWMVFFQGGDGEVDLFVPNEVVRTLCEDGLVTVEPGRMLCHLRLAPGAQAMARLVGCTPADQPVHRQRTPTLTQPSPHAAGF